MWSLIAALISTLLGFGAGSSGLGTPPPGGSIPVVSGGVRTCYEPHPEISLTLSWPLDFQNVPDQRKVLNPSDFGDVSETFDASGDVEGGDGIPECKAYVMNNPTVGQGTPFDREFIQVRKNVRIASCKTDELAGPFGRGKCPDYLGEAAIAARHRGMCTLDGYTDLRKVAEKVVDGQTLEIFWNPFSYNVGCNYEQDNNCGPDGAKRKNVNLKDFIYVLTSRDAFDPQTKPQCPALWDAGAANQEACSHFFDVYLARDLYDKMQTLSATNDPKDPHYFLKQVVENCREQNTFIPAPEADLYLPPKFIPTPFLSPTNPGGGTGKIVPLDAFENFNYNLYVWTRPDFINPATTNLLKSGQTQGTVTLCNWVSAGPVPTAFPTIATMSNCFAPLGQITFTVFDQTGTYNVFTKPATPQTFYLVDALAPATIFGYTITEKTYPVNTRRDPSLQLNVMQLQSANQWTWATPWCKPALYLYPQTPTDINVKLTLDGQLTVSQPAYDADKGWNVQASPDGTLRLKDTSDGVRLHSSEVEESNQTYPYLYYEADLNNVEIPKEGWVIEKSNIKNQISNIMTQIGFNEKEIADFMAYWLPRLTDKPYYFVTLLPKSTINQKERLEFSAIEQSSNRAISPNTIIRSRFVFEGLDSPISVPNLTNWSNLTNRARNGFVVTDWGGTLVGESCDVTVK